MLFRSCGVPCFLHLGSFDILKRGFCRLYFNIGVWGEKVENAIYPCPNKTESHVTSHDEGLMPKATVV